MCGIAGFFVPDGPDETLQSEALAMARTITHRGPDSGDSWVESGGGLALAHRRLAIVDLSPGGAQPMHSGNGRLVIVFNGEIFNYRVLRKELEALGARFRSHSDTEVMLHAIEHWGVRQSLQRFTGQFAFALWDRDRRELTLARDRFGEKPLYYLANSRALLFASELKALAVHRHFDATIDREAVADYLRLGYVSGTRSIYAAVRKIAPGSYRVYRCEPGKPPEAGVEQQYWHPDDAFDWARAHPFRGTFEAAVDELDARLRPIVASRMVADVPLGAFLSGGIDSTAIVALMQSQSATPVRTFTVGFDEGGFDESAHAAAVAAHLGTRHTRLPVSAADALAVVPGIASMYDEPFADSSQIPTHLIARLARREVTVALTGDGGDEVFTGYNRYFWWRSVWGRQRWMPRGVRRMLGRAITSVSASTYDSMFRSAGSLLPRKLRFGNPGERLHKLAPMIAAPSAAALYEIMIAQTQDVASLMRDAPLRASPLQALASDEQIVDYMVRRDLTGYLPDDILVKVDRATMAASLESRAPFLDADLLAFSLSLPLHFRTENREGKLILKRLVDRYVPRALMDRTKAGFAIPLGEWLRGPLREWADELLQPAALEADGLLDGAAIRRIWNSHLQRREEKQHVLWSILVLQAWRREHRAGTKRSGIE